MEQWERDHLRDVTVRFPAGCTVQRKKGVRIGKGTRRDRVTIEKVVIAGVHRDVVLKTNDFMADYLIPDAYEVIV